MNWRDVGECVVLIALPAAVGVALGALILGTDPLRTPLFTWVGCVALNVVIHMRWGTHHQPRRATYR